MALIALTLAGTAISACLASENSRGRTGVCTIVHGRATVQESKYGEILGVPVSIPSGSTSC